MPEPATLTDIVATSNAVRDTPSRLEKRAHLRTLFARLGADDLRLAASYLAGETPQGSLQVGWRALATALESAARPDVLPLFAAVQEADAATALRSPALTAVDAAFAALQRVSGGGAAAKRQGILRQLFAPLTADERHFLSGLVLGELRQGALRAVVLEAVAEAFAVDADAVRRAVMFAGGLGEVLDSLAAQGAEGLARFGPRPGVPVEPMLATPAADLETALAKLGGRAAAEWKLDGVRVQVHRHADVVQVYSRQGRDVTALAPETVALARNLAVRSVILDGELIGLDAQGRPAEFQVLMSRFAGEKDERAHAGASATPAGPEPDLRLVPIFFDVLELDGEPVVERDYAARRALLETLVPAANRVTQRVVESNAAAHEVYAEALQAGHEGLVLKQLDAPYTAGRRGAAWCKVKPAVTLDLVILAAEWGHGRRQGKLSNLHLGARDDADAGRFVHLGKTFKGLTDAMLQELTTDLLAIETHREGHIVHVRPLRVVEIAFDGVQRSPRYDSGFALRFARVKRFRPDKNAAEADTLARVRELHAARR